MKFRRSLVAAVAALALGACVGPTVNVTPLRPAPPGMAPRAVADVQVLEAAPAEGTSVYRIEVSGGSHDELMSALKEKAAGLGCHAIVVTQTATEKHTEAAQQTGQLTDHREVTAARISALCVVPEETRTGSR
jgi:hypothetical protein